MNKSTVIERANFKLAKHPDGHYLMYWVKIYIGGKWRQCRIDAFMPEEEHNLFRKNFCHAGETVQSLTDKSYSFVSKYSLEQILEGQKKYAFEEGEDYGIEFNWLKNYHEKTTFIICCRFCIQNFCSCCF